MRTNSLIAQRPLALLMLTAACGLMAGSAQAALVCSAGASNTPGTYTCTETVTFGPALTDFSFAVLTLDKFLSSAAPGFTQTLTAVNWSVQSRMMSSGTLTNNTNTARTFTLRETQAVTFSAVAGAPSGFLAGTSVAMVDTGALPFSLAAGASTPYSFLGNSATLFGSAANPGAYAGGGTFSAFASTLTDVILSGGGGNIALNLTTAATPRIDLTYTFVTSAVPEAPSVLLMALGLAGLAAALRRRQG